MGEWEGGDDLRLSTSRSPPGRSSETYGVTQEKGGGERVRAM